MNRYVLVPIQDQLMEWYAINAVQYQLLQTLYSWPNMLCSILCGILIDKFSVRKILCISWIITVIGLVLIFLSSFPRDYLFLCIGRTVTGIGNEGLSISLKLYVIHFFEPREYGIVFGVYLAFISCGNGLNSFFSYKVYQWFDLTHSVAIPLVVAPLVSMPLFIAMFLETYYWSNDRGAGDSESTHLITTNRDPQRQRFNLKQIRSLPLPFWMLLSGFVIWCGAAQVALNISVSFLHHTFGVSYAFATTMGFLTAALTVGAYISSGVLSSRFGHIVEMLIFADITGLCGHYIFGWINGNIAWLFVGATLQSLSFGFTYPTVWAAIPLLVEDNVKGTAYGFATAIRFGTIAVSYVVAGVLTDPDDGKRKYIDVQLMLVLLVAVSMVFYVSLWIFDIQCNGSTLGKIPKKERKIKTTTNSENEPVSPDPAVCMQKVSD